MSGCPTCLTLETYVFFRGFDLQIWSANKPSELAKTLNISTGVCEKKTFLLGEPLPCNEAAETALQPLIRCSESSSFKCTSSTKDRFFTDTGMSMSKQTSATSSRPRGRLQGLALSKGATRVLWERHCRARFWLIRGSHMSFCQFYRTLKMDETLKHSKCKTVLRRQGSRIATMATPQL